tara:strand:+ start:7508 stop:7846 length:339 start_codon:yes stop_codon:yes gene_type:complete
MGFFSWKTQDTFKSICNAYSGKETFTVYMLDNQGNAWQEDDYDGYGVFGGKDYYELLAEMNDLDSDRANGISLAFNEAKPVLFPNLVENANYKSNAREEPKNCEFQGYFYES